MTFSKNLDQCRLCLNRYSSLTNVILHPKAPLSDLSLPECISKYFGIEILNNDKYTKMICANCTSLIQGISLYRQKFQDLQKLLIPLVKEEEEECNQEDDSPPLLQPYFGERPQNNVNENSENSSNAIESNKETRNNREVDSRNTNFDCRCHFKRDENYFRVPKDFFKHVRYPQVKINYKERALADSLMYGDLQNSRAEKKIKYMIRKYMHHGYSKGRPGVIRQLIQDQARRTMYISEFDDNKIFKSVYEYDFNLKRKNNLSDLNDDLLEIDMQLDVYVCALCNNVYNSEEQLEAHQETHQKQCKKRACEVISCYSVC